MVVQRPEKPVFVVAAEADDGSVHVPAELQNGLQAALRVRTPVDVVAQEYHAVRRGDLIPELVEQVDQGRKASVNIANGNRGHASLV
jgi:hypothetical protein